MLSIRLRKAFPDFDLDVAWDSREPVVLPHEPGQLRAAPGRRIVSPGLLLSLGAMFSEGGAVFKGLGRPLVGR